MCGIVGTIQKNKKSLDVVIDGLARLEYRGYDSAGVAMVDEKGNDMIYKVLKPESGSIAKFLKSEIPDGENQALVIGHTRWATHGKPSIKNAHPHKVGKIIVVHNGIIENYTILKKFLEDKDYKFKSDTDTEIMAGLIDYWYEQEKDFKKAVQAALMEIHGAYALLIINLDSPDELIATRKTSPLVIGTAENGIYVASDKEALVGYATHFKTLADNELALLKLDKPLEIYSAADEKIKIKLEKIDTELEQINKGVYEHYMETEIVDQARSTAEAIAGRLDEENGTAKLGGVFPQTAEKLRSKATNIKLTACGTSYHAGMVGELMFESVARIPARAHLATHLLYTNPMVDSDMLVLGISQSGETVELIKAMQMAGERGALLFGICNKLGTQIPQITEKSGGGIAVRAGREVAVASTKAFSNQVMVLAMLTLLAARMRHLSIDRGREIIAAMQAIPNKVEKIIQNSEKIKELAKKYYKYNAALFLGRGYAYPVALEGALKIKEIAYIHAQGYEAGEMKHGPIALVDMDSFCLFIVTNEQKEIREKTISNMMEIKARYDECGVREDRIIAIATEGDEKIKEITQDVIYIPSAQEAMLSPILQVVPTQYFAYYFSVMRGYNPDKPRNLAKSVTVE